MRLKVTEQVRGWAAQESRSSLFPALQGRWPWRKEVRAPSSGGFLEANGPGQ